MNCPHFAECHPDGWYHLMPKKMADKIIEELEWMTANYSLDTFSCDRLIELVQEEMQNEGCINCFSSSDADRE